MAPTSTGLSLVRTLLLSLAAIAVFFLIDTVLARTERAESRAAAARAYEEGSEPDEAEPFFGCRRPIRRSDFVGA